MVAAGEDFANSPRDILSYFIKKGNTKRKIHIFTYLGKYEYCQKEHLYSIIYKEGRC